VEESKPSDKRKLSWQKKRPTQSFQVSKLIGGGDIQLLVKLMKGANNARSRKEGAVAAS